MAAVYRKIQNLNLAGHTKHVTDIIQIIIIICLFIIDYIFVINECDIKCVEFDIFYLRYFKHGKGTFGA